MAIKTSVVDTELLEIPSGGRQTDRQAGRQTDRQTHLDQSFGLLFRERLFLEVVEEVDEGVEGDDFGPGRVHAGAVVEDGGRGHGVEHFLLVAPGLEVRQVHGAVACQGACKKIERRIKS